MDIGLASSLDECDNKNCTACHIAHYANTPTETFPICVDETVYRYTNQCKNWMNKDNCTADDPCFISWPADDPAKWRSDDKGCRPLPRHLYEGEFQEGRNECKRDTMGVCGEFGCVGECKWSWPIEDELKWKSPHRMCRCF